MEQERTNARRKAADEEPPSTFEIIPFQKTDHNFANPPATEEVPITLAPYDPAKVAEIIKTFDPEGQAEPIKTFGGSSDEAEQLLREGSIERGFPPLVSGFGV